MIDYNDHASGVTGFARFNMKSSFVQKLSKPGDFLRSQLPMIRAREEGALRSEREYKLVSAVRLDVADLTDQFNDVAEPKVPRQLPGKETSEERRFLVVDFRRRCRLILRWRIAL
jgi:hypothetical protein